MASTTRKSLKRLKSDLDNVFSVFIRLRDADPGGYCECIACGKRMRWQEMQNGHWISRRYLSTRWDERNCSAECPACNCFSSDSINKYSVNIVDKFGDNVQKELMSLRNKTLKPTRSFYEDKIKYYTVIVKDLHKTKGI